MRYLSTLLLLLAAVVSAMAQGFEHSSRVTYFETFQPAVVYLRSGGVNRQKEANIFMKNASLVFKQNGVQLEADMSKVLKVKFGDRVFEVINNQMAELLDTCGRNKLLQVKLINIDIMNQEQRSRHTVTNIDMSDVVAVASIETDGSEMSYPVDLLYFFVFEGKTIVCQERTVKMAIPKQKRELLKHVTHPMYGFRWSNPQDLSTLLHELSK